MVPETGRRPIGVKVDGPHHRFAQHLGARAVLARQRFQDERVRQAEKKCAKAAMPPSACSQSKNSFGAW